MSTTRRAIGLKLIRQRNLGEILLEDGYITEEQLAGAVEEQKGSGGLLGEILVASGYVSEWEVAKCLVGQLQLPFVYTTHYEIPKEAINLLPHAFLHQHRLVPLDIFGRVLVMATAGNISEAVVEEIAESTNYEVALYVALASDVRETLQRKFPLEKVTTELSQRFDQIFMGMETPPATPKG